MINQYSKNHKFWIIPIIIFAISLFSISSGAEILTHSQAAQNQSEAPTDLYSFENNLKKSIAVISCVGKSAPGFFGKYTIPLVDKNNGINSFIITNLNITSGCKTSYATVEFEGKKYLSTVAKQSTDGSDYSIVNSSLNPPTLQVYQEELPHAGWWVSIVSYLPGFGLVFKESVIRLVNGNEFTLLIDDILPTPENGALVFDSNSNFIGVVTRLPGIAPPKGMLLVHGAALQCPSKSRGDTTTSCSGGKFREQVWAAKPLSTLTPTPTVTLKPTPTPTPTIRSLQKQKFIWSGKIVNTKISEKNIVFQIQTDSYLEPEYWNMTDDVCEFDGIDMISLKKPGLCNILFYQLGNYEYEPISDFEVSFNVLSSKQATITCIKGKLTKRITGINPKCPSGYIKK
jgi:hypothetical protein